MNEGAEDVEEQQLDRENPADMGMAGYSHLIAKGKHAVGEEANAGKSSG